MRGWGRGPSLRPAEWLTGIFKTSKLGHQRIQKGSLSLTQTRFSFLTHAGVELRCDQCKHCNHFSSYCQICVAGNLATTEGLKILIGLHWALSPIAQVKTNRSSHQKPAGKHTQWQLSQAARAKLQLFLTTCFIICLLCFGNGFRVQVPWGPPHDFVLSETYQGTCLDYKQT